MMKWKVIKQFNLKSPEFTAEVLIRNGKTLEFVQISFIKIAAILYQILDKSEDKSCYLVMSGWPDTQHAKKATLDMTTNDLQVKKRKEATILDCKTRLCYYNQQTPWEPAHKSADLFFFWNFEKNKASISMNFIPKFSK